jgi:hypothetical protein
MIAFWEQGRQAGWGVFYYKEADWEKLSAAVNGVGGGFFVFIRALLFVRSVNCFVFADVDVFEGW